MSLIEVDLETWARRDHYKLYRALDFPYFSVTVALDVTAWHAAITAAGLPFYPTLVHRVTAVANGLEAFRLRIRGERVVLHERLHPSFTVPWREDLFNFCTVPFEPDLDAFLARCEPAIAATKAADHLLLDEPGRDDMLFISCLPWLAFTGMTQVCDARSGDSFPRVVWGRLTQHGGRLSLPLNLQLHHALADGVHAARFVEHLEAALAAQAASLAPGAAREALTP